MKALTLWVLCRFEAGAWASLWVARLLVLALGLMGACLSPAPTTGGGEDSEIIGAPEVPSEANEDSDCTIATRDGAKAEAHRLAHKLRDPKFYTARTKRAVNSRGAL